MAVIRNQAPHVIRLGQSQLREIWPGLRTSTKSPKLIQSTQKCLSEK